MVFLLSLFILAGCGEPVVGPQGPQGEKGETGAQGPRGPQGEKGETGEAGLPGMNGLNGLNGDKGDKGDDAKEIELFAEDGGVYWRYVGESNSNLLYYYKDTITVTYAKRLYNTEKEIVADFLNDMQGALNAPFEYAYQQAKDATVAAAAALAAAQANEGKVASAALAVFNESAKDEAAAVAYLNGIKAEFLADINSFTGFEDVTAANFYEKLANKFMEVTAVSSGVYTTSGLCKDHPEFLAKYKWLIEYIGSVMGDRKYGNTSLVAFGLKSANDTNVVTSSWNYCDRTIVNSISNCLNNVSENLHGGSSSGATPADFSTLDKYDVATMSTSQATNQAALQTAAANATTAAAEAKTAAEAAEATAKTTCESSIAASQLKADFSNAYELLAGKLINDTEVTLAKMSSDKKASGILYNGHITDLGRKWSWMLGWLVEAFCAAHDGSIDENKYISTAYALLNPAYEGRSDAVGEYRDYLVMSALYNYLYYLRKEDATGYANPSSSGNDPYWKDIFAEDPSTYRSLEQYARDEIFEVLEEVEIDRVGENSWKKYKIHAMTDELVTNAYNPETHIVQGWIDAKDHEVEAIPSNHSIVLFLDLVKKVIVNLEFNGGYTDAGLAKAVGQLFLADVSTAKGSAVDVEGLLSFRVKDDATDNEQLLGTNGTAGIGLFTIRDGMVAKWSFLYEFMGVKLAEEGKTSSSSHKYEFAVLRDNGITTPDGASFATGSYYWGNYNLIAALYNFIKGSNDQKGSGSSYPQPDFTKDSAYAGFSGYAPAAIIEAATLPAGQNDFIVGNGLPTLVKAGNTFAGWALKGDTTNAIVTADNMVDGETYVAVWTANTPA